MELNLGRIGYALSDRLVIDRRAENGIFSLAIADSFWDWLIRVVSWIYSPAFYTDENRRAVACFKTHLLDALGPERLKRISSRYSIDFDRLEKTGSPLLSRTVAQILVGIKDVQVEDIDQLIAKSKLDEMSWPEWISYDFRERLRQVDRSEQLDAATFAEIRAVLSAPFNNELTVPKIEEHISGRPGEVLARVKFDPFRADRERQQLVEEHPTDLFETFAHSMVARVIKREMNVGMFVPAPNRADGTPQFYRLAAKVVTGEGMVSYVFVPATTDTCLPSIRFYRGSAFRTGEIEGIATLITDLERKLGWSAFESGQVFEPIIKEKIPYTALVGHSLGSTIGQYELVRNDRIEEAYLYNGPGVSEEDVLAFNARVAQSEKPIKLVIREVYLDDVSAFGEIHLGFQAPADKVNIDYRRYFPPSNLAATGHSHVHVWPRDEEAYYGIEGGHSPETLNEIFNRKNSGVELIRRNIGPFLAFGIRVLRDVSYYLLNARELETRGLQIGVYENGRYQFSHIRN